MAPPRFRDLQQQALIDTTIIDTGEAAATRVLSDAFRSFERVAGGIANARRSEEGRRAGAEAGRRELPNFREGLAALTAYGRAYNDAALRSYAIRSEVAADEAAARFEAEAGTDPETFRNTFGAWRDETIKNAPPAARAVLGEVYDRRMANGMQRIIIEQHAEIKERSRVDVAEGVARVTDRIAQLRAMNDPVAHAQAEEEEIKLEMLLTGAQNDGTLSAVEAGAARNEADRSIVAQTALARFRNELDNPYGDPLEFIERLREVNKTSEVLTPKEEQEVLEAMLGELRERNALANLSQQASDNEQQARWDAGEVEATQMLLDGALTAGTLSRLHGDDQLDPAVARTLLNELQSGNDRPDDARERLRVEIDLLNIDEKDVLTNGALSFQTRRELILKRRELSNTWRGTQQAREAVDRIDRALGLVPGADPRTLSDEEIRARDQALTEFYDAVDVLPAGERQSKALTTSGEIVERVIKRTANAEAIGLREALETYKQRMGDPADFSESKRKKYEERVSMYEQQIRAAEQRAK